MKRIVVITASVDTKDSGEEFEKRVRRSGVGPEDALEIIKISILGDDALCCTIASPQELTSKVLALMSSKKPLSEVENAADEVMVELVKQQNEAYSAISFLNNMMKWYGEWIGSKGR